jgi:hypothetical protein
VGEEEIMNRRSFIKTVPAIAALPAIVSAEKEEKDPVQFQGDQFKCSWSYRVYCYERGQGEWTFATNTRGSFASEREYMTFDEEESNGYLGFMYDGVLHFQTFDDATDFIWMHVKAKDDTNIIDTIYDVYFKRHYEEGEGGVEIQVAHYWFNGDTGSQIHWETDGFNRKTGEGLTDWNKVEGA